MLALLSCHVSVLVSFNHRRSGTMGRDTLDASDLTTRQSERGYNIEVFLAPGGKSVFSGRRPIYKYACKRPRYL